jgi:hypothetical protein
MFTVLIALTWLVVLGFIAQSSANSRDKQWTTRMVNGILGVYLTLNAVVWLGIIVVTGEQPADYGFLWNGVLGLIALSLAFAPMMLRLRRQSCAQTPAK